VDVTELREHSRPCVSTIGYDEVNKVKAFETVSGILWYFIHFIYS